MGSVGFGLLSAIFWGSGDFWGGMVSRRIGAYRAVFYAEIVGLAMLFAGLVVTGEQFPDPGKFWLAVLAGMVGTGGLIILYHAMATGLMSIATPVSALLAAALPVVTGIFLDGIPELTALLGFLLAFLAVWLVSQDNSDKPNLQRFSDLYLPLFAGLCFGAYFVLIHSASDSTVIWPMVGSRSGGMAVVVIAMIFSKTSWKMTGERPWKLIVLNAFLDIFGNAFFIIAGQFGRLDIAAILGSMYPGATVLLAWYYLKEKLNGLQWAGIISALVAIVLLTI